MTSIKKIKYCCFCKEKKFLKRFHYKTPPKKEMSFNIKAKNYDRKFLTCKSCGHWFASHNLNLKKLYTGTYNKITYNNNIHKGFLKIISLPKKKSDNYFRIKRINSFKKNIIKKTKKLVY